MNKKIPFKKMAKGIYGSFCSRWKIEVQI